MTSAGMLAAAAVHGTVRATTAAEDEVVAEVLARCGRRRHPVLPTVVFAYPGHGVGESYRGLAGCTNQMLLLGTAVERMIRCGVDVLAMSTEEPKRNAHLETLRGRIGVVAQADALRLSHHSTADGTFLERCTFVLIPGEETVAVGNITDSVSHTQAVLDYLERLSHQTFGGLRRHMPR